MSITKDAGVQAPSVKRVEFALANFTSGAAAVAIDLPSDAEVTGGSVVVSTAFNSGTSDTLTVGDLTTNDRYKAGVDGQTAARTALIPTGLVVSTANQRQVVIKWTGVGTAATAGAGHLLVEYIQTSRADFVQR